MLTETTTLELTIRTPREAYAIAKITTETSADVNAEWEYMVTRGRFKSRSVAKVTITPKTKTGELIIRDWCEIFGV